MTTTGVPALYSCAFIRRPCDTPIFLIVNQSCDTVEHCVRRGDPNGDSTLRLSLLSTAHSTPGGSDAATGGISVARMRGRRRHLLRCACVASPTSKLGRVRRLNELMAMILPTRSSSM